MLVGRFLNAGYLREYGTSSSRGGGPCNVCGDTLLGFLPVPLRCLPLAYLHPVTSDTLLMGLSIPTTSTFGE